MRFILVEPRQQRMRPIDVEDIEAAKRLAQLPKDVDFGTVFKGVSIIVYGQGLYEPPDDGRYFALNGQLYSGNAILFAYSHRGETIDLIYATGERELKPIFFRDGAEIEAAIAAGKVERPTAGVNGVVMWEWPGPDNDWGSKAMAANAGKDMVIDNDTMILGIPETKH